MSFFNQFMLKVRRGDGTFYRVIHKIGSTIVHSNFPVPFFLRPFYRFLYSLHHGILFLCRWALNYFYREPAFRSRCTSVGRNLRLWLLPDVRGHAKIYIGNNVSIYGHLGVGSGRIFDDPVLIIKDGVDLGHNVFITVNKEVIIEEQANIASNVSIVDTDGHPRDAELRAQKLPPGPEDVKPVRIGRRAWIGQGCYIMKGVTIGEGAIIGVNSVVITDIPPYSVALGNPARVVIKDSRTKAPTSEPASSIR